MKSINERLIIIGGGAAGIMAAISAKKHHPEVNVIILDRTFALGRKILVCGAGRCNITNINLDKSIEDHYYGGSSDFISSVFQQFSFKDIVEFFEELGIGLYVERKTDIGKLFPLTDQAKTVTALLEDELQRLGVEVILNTEVNNIKKLPDGFEVQILNIEDGRVDSLKSNYLILSAGGKTYPALGSNGSGYQLAQSLGHSIVEPVPSALPLVSKNQLSHLLQGTKMEIEVSSIIEGKIIKTRTDDVMFTQYGLSGPAILNVSREISIQINRNKKNDVKVKLNFFPGMNFDDVLNLLRARWSKRPNQTLEKSLYGIFPNKIPPVLISIAGLSKDVKVSNLSNEQVNKLASLLNSFEVNISETKGWNEAEFTAGGISTNEVKSKSLESKMIAGLYFCGEILDVDGDVGGFNLSWAWSSGFVAGLLN
jgi:predicted Rossmann fold flavoprotein